MIKAKRSNALVAILMIVCGIVFVSPLYICIVMALKTPQETALSVIGLPKSLTLDNFREAIERTRFARSFANSLLVTGVSTVCIVLMSAMCGYVLCRNRANRFYRAANQLLFFGIMIPFQVIMIPVYRMFKELSLLNSYEGIILLLIGSSIPYATFLTTGFVRNVPMDLEEAAWIDGCSVWGTFWRVVFPLLKPIVSTVGILHFLWMWNEFSMSFIVLQKEAMRTLPIQQYHFFGQFSVNLNLGFASACLSMIPVILFFAFTQRLLIQGVTAGAVKG
ncbi:carbohydrate ABC transporter permease [Cohnella fermenti]|uniref:Carbohydrate ABC transporter permease n=1 Tax=Cohnella fermenti TaxID=2565925 RepID=A0A4S4BP48_9BACL|nr:carbohydrate ABC transporter permease [Cohnella fermenti]THF74314.1 carbohydrate ABC transporter permease [Cohnella fermenti]